ncbi:hypothetical protein LTR99_000432 [Exophiala xenobiotica]|uniref:Exonuclease domain-containing protein n=1 Tax=Vermiconidia calcicola TaxID=1690605 RepID=A0AAV9QLG6_9PEZI|nr:hypothetical protein LTR99_000432 [Exophiala xenobiotica]KAK5439463.1 hypothetical protein LTR34_000431 [Exophiala xenobiotica]KAK5543740.1 hypothetical protein LTR25_001354 [Vermiconidia calcicola]KAK5548418.1 hypothetical protein LTR23_001547 [Chaetothyriales sp. CCFEE 6169]
MEDSVKHHTCWSTIEETPVNVEKLLLLCHNHQQLKKESYILDCLTPAQIDAKSRCVNCNARVKRRPKSSNPLNHVPLNATHRNGQDLGKNDAPGSKDIQKLGTPCSESSSTAPGSKSYATPPSPKCRYHTGKVRNKIFSCCRKHVSQPGCVSEQEHTPPPFNDPTVRQYWQYHPTPDYSDEGQLIFQPRRQSGKKAKQRNQQKRQYDSAPESPARTPFNAIALDCEMGVSITGESELIRISAVDFFTGSVLLDKLVQPSVPMMHYNTRYSGVTWTDMWDAVRNGTCIYGRDMAREMLWKHIRPETIVVVHGGRNDFEALRWIHTRVIDSFILESYTGIKTEGGRSLQNLCLLKLGIAVQQKDVRKGHDSLEDAMACRELVIDWMNLLPDT